MASLFNHDLLLDEMDQQNAKAQWPALDFAIIPSAAFQECFLSHEGRANVTKRAVHAIGSIAVICLLVVSLQSVVGLAYPGVVAAAVSKWFEGLGLLGFCFAVVASRFVLRRHWLKSRFVTEVLRQWHFRRLLEVDRIAVAAGDASARAKYEQERSASYEALVNTRLSEHQRAHAMRNLIESSLDPIKPVSHGDLIKLDEELAQQWADSYYELRLLYQHNYMAYKLSDDAKSLFGMSPKMLTWVTDVLAAGTLMFALVLSCVQLFIEVPWAPFVSLMLVIAGVGVRAWRDGLALTEEFESFEEAFQRLSLLEARWKASSDVRAKIDIAFEVETAALEELRAFLRKNMRAQFLF